MADNNVVTFLRRRDNAPTSYVRIGTWRFVADEPVYEVPKVIADQLEADASLVVEVGTENKADRDKRLKEAEAVTQAEEDARAAKLAARAAARDESTQVDSEQEESPAEPEGETQTDEGQEG